MKQENQSLKQEESSLTRIDQDNSKIDLISNPSILFIMEMSRMSTSTLTANFCKFLMKHSRKDTTKNNNSSQLQVSRRQLQFPMNSKKKTTLKKTQRETETQTVK